MHRIAASQLGVKDFNEPQQLFLSAYSENGPQARYVLAFKPGAGKTLMAAMWLHAQGNQGIVVTPFRSLCQQTASVLASLELGFSEVVCLLGGDDADSAFAELLAGTPKVIVCTPEVAVSVLGTLKPGNRPPLVLDEVHLLHDSQRGYLYDLLLRFWAGRPCLAMSGTLGKASIEGLQALPNRDEPVVVLNDGGAKLSDLALARYEGKEPPVPYVARLLLKLEAQGQVLCFVASKRYGYELLKTIRQAVPTLSICFHSADLDFDTRAAYEEGFYSGEYRILIHTQTLVTGMDFDVTAGVVAQVKTGMGEVAIYDVIQAASRVGRRRKGKVYVMVPSAWDAQEYLTRVATLDCGPTLTASDVDTWVAASWAAWGQELGVWVPSVPQPVRTSVGKAQDALKSAWITSLRQGLSPLTAVECRSALAQAGKLLDKSIGVGVSYELASPELLADALGKALYRVQEIRNTISYPSNSISGKLLAVGSYSDSGGKWRAQLSDGIFRVGLKQGKPEASHKIVWSRTREILARMAPAVRGLEAEYDAVRFAFRLE